MRGRSVIIQLDLVLMAVADSMTALILCQVLLFIGNSGIYQSQGAYSLNFEILDGYFSEREMILFKTSNKSSMSSIDNFLTQLSIL